MERIKFYIALLFVQLFCLNMNGQNWILTDSEGHTINTALADSITYEYIEGKYVQNIWRGGSIISNIDVEYGMNLEPQNSPLEYDLYTVEEDGTDAVLASDGSYALFCEPEDNDKVVFVSGVLGDDDREYMVMDKEGYLNAMTIDGTGLVTFFYTPDQLWVLDNSGQIIAEIPYSYFEESVSAKAPLRVTRASGLSRNPIYNALTLHKQIKDYLKKPIKTFCLDLFRHFANGAGRNGEMLSNFIDAALDWTDLLNLLALAEKLNETQFFGNASILTLPAEVDFLDAKLSCEVNGLPSEKSIWYNFAKEKYTNLVNYNFELSMELCDNVEYSSSLEKQNKNITSDGKQSFDFTLNKLSHTYYYEPSLRLDITIEVDGRAAYKATVGELPSGRHEIPEGITTHKRSCTIYGERETFYTPGVSCSINKIENVTDKSATVECWFSKLPSSADNYIQVKNTETGAITKASASKTTDKQTVSISGLVPFTIYEVCAIVSINSETVESETKTFVTDLPDISGTWNCTEEYYTGWDYSQKQTKNYTIVLNEDGSADVNDGSTYVRASWNFSSRGDVTINVSNISTQTQNVGTVYEGRVNNIKNPTKIEGGRYTWAYNQVIGYVRHDDYHSITLTK